MPAVQAPGRDALPRARLVRLALGGQRVGPLPLCRVVAPVAQVGRWDEPQVRDGRRRGARAHDLARAIKVAVGQLSAARIALGDVASGVLAIAAIVASVCRGMVYSRVQ